MRMNKKIKITLVSMVLGTGTISAQTTFNELTYTKDVSSFKLNAPSKAKSVKVNIYNEGTGGTAVKTVKMKRTGNDLWTADIKGDLKGMFYTFQVETKQQKMNETPGVFAKAVGLNGRRGAIIDMAETNPEGWCCDQKPLTKQPTDLVIYEVIQYQQWINYQFPC